ncbi:MAG: NADH-quinone oxidoreductase subunit M [Geitlerinemataceae cyanobacterium]
MLSALIFIPLLLAVAVGLVPERVTARGLRVAMLVASSVLFALALAVAWQFDAASGAMQLVERRPWLELLGVSYSLGVDGLSLPLLVLNGFLTLVAIGCTSPTLERPRLYYCMLWLLNAGVVGAFVAQDLILFFLFYELELIPLYFLIAIWGGARRSYAATKFLLYTAISGVAILSAFLGVVWLSGAPDFSYSVGLGSSLAIEPQIVLLATLLFGLAIKIPIVPLHTWLPDAHVEASTPVSVLLAGVLLKLGTYGLLRFGIGLFPEAWLEIAPVLATLAAISALYGAFAAIAQQDMKKMVAYSSIAHMGYILLAAAAGTELGILAAIAQMVAHGLISALLFLLVGIVAKKTGTRDLNVLRGLLNPQRGLPIVGSLIVLGVMASSGLPGLMGFVAEFMVFRGSFSVYPLQTLACIVGTGLTAVYFLLMINRVFFGRLPDRFGNLPPVQWHETISSMAIASLLVVYGLMPSLFLDWSQAQISTLVPRVIAPQEVIVPVAISPNQSDL